MTVKEQKDENMDHNNEALRQLFALPDFWIDMSKSLAKGLPSGTCEYFIREVLDEYVRDEHDQPLDRTEISEFATAIKQEFFDAP